MKRFLDRHFTSAHAIALLALFVAIGGTAYAATKIGTKQIKNNAVTAAKIKNSAVTAAKIKANAVTSGKIKSAAVTSGKLAGGAVTAAKLADSSVTPAKMTDYFNSGLIKLSNGENRVVFEKGPLTLTAKCTDGGGGSSIAEFLAENTGTEAGVFESDNESNYADPVFDPGEVLNAFYPVVDSNPYWFGDYYNMFSMTSGDGSTSLYGGGNIGVKVLGADCVFQLFTWGA